MFTFGNGDVIMVRLNYSLDGNFAFNVLHYQIAAFSGVLPGPFTTLALIGESAEQLWGATWAAGASNQVSFLGASTQRVYPTPRSKLVTFSAEFPIQGDIVSEALPLQDSPTIIKDTDFGERWGLGRVFYVGVPESMANNGSVIVGATRTALNALAAKLNDNLDVIGDGWTMTLNPVLYHAATAATVDKPATATRITKIVGGHVNDNVIKSMRSRRPGKGI